MKELFGVSLPIIQAPMAGAQGSALTIAVSKAGGLGSLPCAMLNKEDMRREILQIQSQTDKPFNVNFFCHRMPDIDADRDARWAQRLAPYFHEFDVPLPTSLSGPSRMPFGEDALNVIEELRPPIVSFHFGLPSQPLFDRVKATGAKIISSATTIEEALWLEAHGVDAIIAQGLEAGGHRGMFLTEDITTQMGTLALVRQIIQHVNLPVIAAGGIADAKAVAAVLDLGAVGAQIGTAYLRCPESTINALHRSALASPAARHTALTNVFTGRPARGIVNRAVRELGPMSDMAPPFPLASSWLTPLRAKLESMGSADFMPMWAGQNTSGCLDISAFDLTLQLAALCPLGE
jgi:nitronate monooxygenase